ncbi:MAG: hypothetical protein J6S53_02915 [Lentisphaeria bacterium]|nr:hypothetical protein [Lentisphaeria bacterium]
MNLTDQEKIMLSSVAEKVKKYSSRIYPELPEGENSSFSREMDTDFLGEEVCKEYDFSTPVEFRKRMEEIWERRGVVEMKSFSVPAAVALFKNKPENGSRIRKSDGKISEYIYEF